MPPRRIVIESVYDGGEVNPHEENVGLHYFNPERAHLLLQIVYEDSPHHNDGWHLDGGFPDTAVWQCRWRWTDAQSSSWYAIPYRSVGCRLTEILDV